jgi:predicted metal-binding membrane protein
MARQMAHGDMTMLGMGDMLGMTDMPNLPWTAATFALTALMWWIMMIGMMVPSAAPTVLLFAGVQRHYVADKSPAPQVSAFTAGYLVTWAGFSVLAAALQWWLNALTLISPMQMVVRHWLGIAFVAAAGIYQLTPLKNVCLRHCRSPAEFLASHRRSGAAGPLRMGAEHGAFCVGCCWLLMGILFFAGVMDLAWVAALAVLVLAEKLLPRGELLARASGVALLGYAAALALRQGG